MSDEINLPPPAPVAVPEAAPPPGPRSKALRIALAVSVALNLGVLGVVAGALLHDGGMMGARDGVRELGFGPFTEALNGEERSDLRRAFFEKAPDFRAGRKQMRADTQSLLVALRADPFDPDALRTIMESQRQRMIGQLELGQGLMRDLLLSMTPEARLAFADRLEARLQHGDKDDHKADKPQP